MFKYFKMLISYITGVMSGMFIFMGIAIFMGRDGTVGGEVLILPLFVMLIAIGYWFKQERMEWKYYKEKNEN